MKINKQFIRGFTIIELLVVIVIIGILATITFVSYGGFQNRAITISLQSDLVTASDLIVIDQAHSGTQIFPATLADVDGGGGVPASVGTTYQYVVNNTNTPKTFCLTATRNNQSYFITQEGKPMPGPCPVVYFDPSIETSYPRTGTSLNDLSGNSNNGVLSSGVDFASINGGALNFDGASQESVLVSGLSNNVPTKFTAEAWVNSRNVAVDQTVMSRNGPFFIRISNSRFRVGIYTGTWLLTTGSIVLTSNAWHHLVLVYDGTLVRSYVDGVLDLNVAKTGNMTAFSTIYIGYPPNAGEQYNMNGYVGVARIYNRALSDSEVNQNFSNLRIRYGI